jgi:hypothetical protein
VGVPGVCPFAIDTLRNSKTKLALRKCLISPSYRNLKLRELAEDLLNGREGLGCELAETEDVTGLIYAEESIEAGSETIARVAFTVATG